MKLPFVIVSRRKWEELSKKDEDVLFERKDDRIRELQKQLRVLRKADIITYDTLRRHDGN